MNPTRLGMWIAVAIGLGVALGAALGNVGMGAALGPAIGVVIWALEAVIGQVRESATARDPEADDGPAGPDRDPD